MVMKTDCSDVLHSEGIVGYSPGCHSLGCTNTFTLRPHFPWDDPSQRLTVGRALGQALSRGMGTPLIMTLKTLVTFEHSSSA